ncbi:unnamed protein product [Tenebrio molitor]|nr:unnamed protein product [Tenebrio molitor]
MCCGRNFCSRKDLDTHNEKRHQQLTCDKCNKVFKNWGGLRRHDSLMHRENYKPPNLHCGLCDKTFTKSGSCVRPAEKRCRPVGA